MASESGWWLNLFRVIPGRGCGAGVVGYRRRDSAGFLMVLRGVSGMLLGWVAVVGESPVHENSTRVMVGMPE